MQTNQLTRRLLNALLTYLRTCTPGDPPTPDVLKTALELLNRLEGPTDSAGLEQRVKDLEELRNLIPRHNLKHLKGI